MALIGSGYLVDQQAGSREGSGRTQQGASVYSFHEVPPGLALGKAGHAVELPFDGGTSPMPLLGIDANHERRVLVRRDHDNTILRAGLPREAGYANPLARRCFVHKRNAFVDEAPRTRG
jgi:hypothetical protein